MLLTAVGRADQSSGIGLLKKNRKATVGRICRIGRFKPAMKEAPPDSLAVIMWGYFKGEGREEEGEGKGREAGKEENGGKGIFLA